MAIGLHCSFSKHDAQSPERKDRIRSVQNYGGGRCQFWIPDDTKMTAISCQLQTTSQASCHTFKADKHRTAMMASMVQGATLSLKATVQSRQHQVTAMTWRLIRREIDDTYAWRQGKSKRAFCVWRVIYLTPHGAFINATLEFYQYVHLCNCAVPHFVHNAGKGVNMHHDPCMMLGDDSKIDFDYISPKKVTKHSRWEGIRHSRRGAAPGTPIPRLSVGRKMECMSYL